MKNDLYADLESHHISGFVAHSGEHIKIPLISEVFPNLWQGGCYHGVELPHDFDHVFSLYPWEKYKRGPNTSLTELKMFDSHEAFDEESVNNFAKHAYDLWSSGKKILVHCQAGLNRSGLVCAKILMHAGRDAETAISILRDNRSSQVLCNTFFVEHLIGATREADQV